MDAGKTSEGVGFEPLRMTGVWVGRDLGGGVPSSEGRSMNWSIWLDGAGENGWGKF